MEKLREKISSIIKKHEHFEYYELLIEKAEKNIDANPDICIETCKSLIEGISKQILKSFDPQIKDNDFKGRNNDCHNIFCDALNKLAENSELFEYAFINRYGQIIQLLAELRNKRGDISHGKLAPKDIMSDAAFSLFIYQTTEAIVLYMLNSFDKVDFSFQEELKYGSKDLEEYNDWLDENYPLEGVIKYSRALYDQDYDAYVAGLDTYNEDEND